MTRSGQLSIIFSKSFENENSGTKSSSLCIQCTVPDIRVSSSYIYGALRFSLADRLTPVSSQCNDFHIL